MLLPVFDHLAFLYVRICYMNPLSRVRVYLSLLASLFFLSLFEISEALKRGYGYRRDPRIKSHLKSFTSLTSRSSPNAPEDYYVRKALEIKEKVEHANYKDIHKLLDLLREAYPGVETSKGLPEDIIAAVLKRIEGDKELLKAYKQCLDAQKGALRGSCPLRTSLDKLLGGAAYPGILDKSLRMLRESIIDFRTAKVDGRHPYDNVITVLKNTLYYLLLEAKYCNHFKDLKVAFGKMKLFYPAILPEVPEFKSKILACGLYDELDGGVSCLQIPNAGYVFGGDWIGGKKCRGVDCSSFVSYVTNSSTRLITEWMELIWRHKNNESFEGLEKKRLESFLKSPGASTLNEYEPIDFTKDPSLLHQADLVVWRTPLKNSRSGHVAMFLCWSNPERDEFLGIDASRADDGNLEGVGIRLFKLNREGYRTYVLRRTLVPAKKEPTNDRETSS
jgi:hypothetical protein